MDSIDIAVGNIPETAIHNFRQTCWRHTLGFVVPAVGLDQAGPMVDVQQAGSGTLVRTNSGLAILTAAHVADTLQRSGKFGIIVQSAPISRHYLNADYFVFHKLGEAPYDPKTLDIALICIPPAANHTFERGVVPLKLSPHIACLSDANFSPLLGLAGVFGIVDEFTRDLSFRSGLDGHKGFSLAGAIGIADEWNRDHENDVISLEAERLCRAGPTDWSGVSGGGFWHAGITQGPSGTISLKKPVLCGVMFYQGSPNDSGRRLFAQGPNALLRLFAEAPA